MGWSTPWPPGLTELLGPVEAVGPLSGSARRIRVVGPARGAGPGGSAGAVLGTDAVLETGAGAADEAAGLRRLGAVDGVRVPPVLAAGADWLVTGWVDSGRRTERAEVELGRGLAHLHLAGAGEWGGGSAWIGRCRVDPAPAPDGAAFYGRRLSALAALCGLAGAVAPVVDRLGELIPPGAPAILHGDLWWGNILFGPGDRPWLIDPSVHGGHPEEDLAMLALFGPVPGRVLDAYREIRGLDAGWQERVGLFQLYPLLVHTVLFGGSYRASAEAVARRYT